ncbi:DHA2 family efflux MFS transporter permease subunit [Novosphingobium sp. G106]|uniref:DHA2 family efflux MFS transporter permease subunit n=1 Tax=Novosphingobium sp. G106 TaxID=2849500 RepID=UPI001C2D3B5D|nr:DHA2 family efflux MFS transporter permease subunit [Novosphingobium sp. G106]
MASKPQSAQARQAEEQTWLLIPPSRRILAGMILALSNFMVVLDITIANVSIPHISGNLGISLDQGAWVITSYAVAEAICVPLTGWLSQRFGAVRCFMMAMVGFGIFSFLCGSSVTLGMLIACRIGQGLCGAPLMPMSQTLLLRVFPPENRTAAMGIWAMTTLAGPALGPIIGGYISDNISWHWIFFINLPVAAFCVVMGYLLLRPVETKISKLPIDAVGLALLIFWIGCLQVMLDIGRDHDWFGDPKIVMLAIGAAIGFCVFIIWELTEEHPIVNLRIFRNRGFSAGVFTLAFGFGAYFASIVLIPQWLQSSMGYTATKAGLITAFTAIAAIAVAQIAAKMLAWADPRVMISCAIVWMALMTLLRTGWTTGADFWTLAMPQILQGLAMPFFMVPLTSVSLAAVKPEEVPSAAGLQNFLRTMAIAVSTSLALTTMGDAQRVSRSELVGKLQPDATVGTLSGMGMSAEQGRQTIANLVEDQATMLAVDHTFWITAFVLFFAAALVWVSPRPKKMPAQGAGGH